MPSGHPIGASASRGSASPPSNGAETQAPDSSPVSSRNHTTRDPSAVTIAYITPARSGARRAHDGNQIVGARKRRSHSGIRGSVERFGELIGAEASTGAERAAT